MLAMGGTISSVPTGDTGEVTFGKDYYQMLMLWSLPAAVKGQDMGGPTREGGLVARMIAAAN